MFNIIFTDGVMLGLQAATWLVVAWFALRLWRKSGLTVWVALSLALLVPLGLIALYFFWLWEQGTAAGAPPSLYWLFRPSLVGLDAGIVLNKYMLYKSMPR